MRAGGRWLAAGLVAMSFGMGVGAQMGAVKTGDAAVAGGRAGDAGGPFYGFDQNIYPGDAALPVLRRSLAYAGYWLNVPPGAKVNSWKGKRGLLREQGFGFLVLWNGRLEAQLKGRDAAALGKADGAAAGVAARREGFPEGAVIFLDVEEGGRMTAKQAKYFAAWVEAVRGAKFAAGVYCSGIAVEDGPGKTISTADDVHTRDKDVKLWVANDGCPPSPGCVVGKPGVGMKDLGRTDAVVWQYTQSPLRKEFALSCKATYAADGNCYAPGTKHDETSLLDLDMADTADPSGGR